MARKSKAPSPEKAAKRTMTPEEQSELFIRMARELGVDETGKEFERAFDNIAPPKKLINDNSPAPERLRRNKDG